LAQHQSGIDFGFVSGPSDWGVMESIALFLLLLRFGTVRGDVYDFFMPMYKSGCAGGRPCANWSSNPKAAELFTGGRVPPDAANYCAMPAVTAGAHECDCAEKSKITYIEDSYAGPWCYCDDGHMAYCTPPNSTVEQLNLQLASSKTVVAAFITYEELPSSPAVAMFGTSPDDMKMVEGASHKYSPPGRTYIMHFIPFRDLEPRKTYFYKVKSGCEHCKWTDTYSFRAPYSSGETRIATYGDMGHSFHNNMGNMKADCEAGTIDAIVHMGDHAYDMGYSGDERGDAYMNVFQPVLQGCPWMPIIGNHESDDGDHYKRYEEIAAGEIIGDNAIGTNSTSHSALGRHLSLGRLYGTGVHGSVPSNTSRYTSTDLGLIHLVGIDLMNFDAKQITWLEADLGAASKNRAQVPWIMVMAHYQVYHQTVFDNWDASAEAFFSDAGENWNQSHRFAPCNRSKCQTLGQWHVEIAGKLEPILLKYGVDIYNAGHIHDYESTWPMKQGKVCQKSYDNPTCPVYVVEGNGGVPGAPGNCTLNKVPRYDWVRVHGSECGAYGRITITNATTLRYDHVVNSNGVVFDSFTITQEHHGPFSAPVVELI